MSTTDPTSDRPLDHRDASYYRLPVKRRPVLALFGWVGFVLACVAGAIVIFANEYAGYALSNPDNNSKDTKEAELALAPEPKNLPDQPVNILVLGSDARPGDRNGDSRSDTMILVRLDFKRNFVSQLSFPRDLYVQIPGHGPDKINAAYSSGGTKRVIETVKQLTGESTIHYFFNVNFNAFRRLVNDAGGVWLDIDRYYYNDNSGSGQKFEPLNIKPGYQRLRGHDALDYVRYRHTDSDFSRIARQQLFLAELKRETRGAKGLDNIIDAVHHDVITNLDSPNRLRQLLQFGMSVDKDRVARVTVGSTGLGTRNGGQSVVETTDGLIRKSVEQWKNPDFQNPGGVTGKRNPPAKTIVAVYNGSKQIGVGADAGKQLESRGYPVLLGGNSPNGFFPSTSVFYAPDRADDAKALARLFGPNASTAERRKGMFQDADLLVYVGADYDGVKNPTPPKKAQSKPDTVPTLALKSVIQRFRQQTKLDALVPMKLPRGSEVVHVRSYSIERGDHGPPNALVTVVRIPGVANSVGGGNRYVTITQTSQKDLPLLETMNGPDKSGAFTNYDGQKMQRLLWRRGNMTYWITNSLDMGITEASMRDMRTFMVRPKAARLKKGQTDAGIRVNEKGRTP